MFLLNILYGLLGLGFVVIVHEAGHFLAARAVGIEVEVFSVGWGKKLISFKRGKTEYRLSAIPLGGFARMKGELAYRRALEEQRNKIEFEEHSFFSAKPWQRIIVVIAGPVANLIFAVLFLSLINFIGFTYSSFPNKIVLADDFPEYYTLTELKSPAAVAGLRTGDIINAVNGNEVDNFTMLQQEIATRALETVTLSVQRGSEQLLFEADLILNEESGSGILGVFPYVEPVVASDDSNNSQVKETPDGLQENDRIIEVNGREVYHVYEIRKLLDELPLNSEESFVDLLIMREDELIAIRHSLTHDGESFFIAAYEGAQYKKSSTGLFPAIEAGLLEVFSTFAMTVKGLGLLFRGLSPTSALSGPLRITYIIGEVTARGMSVSVAEGIRSFFHLLSLLSVALCFGNLLPIPVLDGGQILITIVEILKGSPVSPKTFFRYQTVGATIIIVFIIFILFFDIVNIIRVL